MFNNYDDEPQQTIWPDDMKWPASGLRPYQPITQAATPEYASWGAYIAATSSKPTNPKDIVGSDKLPLHLWPQTATAFGCMALLEGCLKYGRANWRHIGVRASIYYDALNRHMSRWFEGEDIDADSGLPHLAKALACLAILVDAQQAGKLNDDRQTPGGMVKTIEELTPHVARLKQQHAAVSATVKHYTIADSVAAHGAVDR